VPIDPRNLRPSELARLLNSTPLGRVIDERRLYWHRMRAGFRIGNGIANRCSGQLYKGRRTHIGWTAKDIVLPTIQPEGWADDERLQRFLRPDGYSPASGAIIKVAGITGRIRGMKSKMPNGRSVRPSLVVLDDPQTDESARSLSQCATRESILAGAVLGLAGPGKKISGIMPCTVIRPGDMADRILDRDKHPQWQGETSNTRVETVTFGWHRGRVTG